MDTKRKVVFAVILCILLVLLIFHLHSVFAKYFARETAISVSYQQEGGEGSTLLLTGVVVCPYRGFNTTKMETELGLSPEHWNLNVPVGEGDNDEWGKVGDKAAQDSAWKGSTYSVGQILKGVSLGSTFSKIDSKLTLEEASEAAKSSDNVLEVTAVDSPVYGRCALVKDVELKRGGSLKMQTRRSPAQVFVSTDGLEELELALDASLSVGTKAALRLEAGEDATMEVAKYVRKMLDWGEGEGCFGSLGERKDRLRKDLGDKAAGTCYLTPLRSILNDNGTLNECQSKEKVVEAFQAFRDTAGKRYKPACKHVGLESSLRTAPSLHSTSSTSYSSLAIRFSPASPVRVEEEYLLFDFARLVFSVCLALCVYLGFSWLWCCWGAAERIMDWTDGKQKKTEEEENQQMD